MAVIFSKVGGGGSSRFYKSWDITVSIEGKLKQNEDALAKANGNNGIQTVHASPDGYCQ